MVKKRLKGLDFSKIGKNITALMQRCGIDATALSHHTDLPASTICRLRSNSTESSPNLSSLIPIADFFRVTLSQLVGEEPIDQSIYGTFKPNKITKFPIPVLSAETVVDFLQNKKIDDAPFVDIDTPLSSKAFGYFVRGNAMEPQFPDNTLLIIEPEAVLENLDHVLVIPAGRQIPIFRQVMIDGDEKFLRTLNPAFNEFTKFTETTHSLLGVMMQSRRNFKGAPSSLYHRSLKVNA